MYGLNLALLNGSYLDRFRETYRSLTQGAAGGAAAARAHYDVYFDAARGDLTCARAPCVPADLAARFFLHVIPADAGDLPDHRVQYGFDNLDFRHPHTPFDGKCLAAVRLPEYAVDHVRTGQFHTRRDEEGIRRYDTVWEVSFSLGDLDGSDGGAPPH